MATDVDLATNHYHDNVPTAEECQAKCQERSECQGFSHRNTWCYLKSVSEPVYPNVNDDSFISGPKYCSCT